MTEKEYVDNLFGEKSYTHSPFSVYRNELYTWLEEYADLKAKKAWEAAYWLGSNDSELKLYKGRYEQWKELQEDEVCDHRALESIGDGLGSTYCPMCNTYNPNN